MLYSVYLDFHRPRQIMRRRVLIVLCAIDRALPIQVGTYQRQAREVMSMLSMLSKTRWRFKFALSIAYRRSPNERVGKFIGTTLVERPLSSQRKDRPRLARSYCMSRRPGRPAGSIDVAHAARPDDVVPIESAWLKSRTARSYRRETESDDRDRPDGRSGPTGVYCI
jgi:hypothetical protein